MPQFEKVCPVCNWKFKTSILSQKYCCWECRLQAQSMEIPVQTLETVECKECGKPFTQSYRGETYCSKECKLIAKQKEKENNQIKSEERACQFCNNIFIWSSNKPTQKYCSKECQKKAQIEKAKKSEKLKKQKKSAIIEERVRSIVTDLIYRAKNADEPDEAVEYWGGEIISDDTRETVFERDHYRCQICGSALNMRLHMIVSRQKGGDHSVDNLITLCDGCRRHIETGDLEYAINRCIKNAYRSHHVEIESDQESRTELLDDAIYILQNLFSEFSSYYPEEKEYLRRIDTVIDWLEEVREK